MPRRVLATYCFFFFFVALTAASHADLVVNQLQTARHERFANQPTQFIGSATIAGGTGLNFSGIARGENGYWATMISPTHLISAAHAYASGTVVFHHDNDPNGSSTLRTVTGGSRIGMTDIWVGTLNAPVDPQLVAIYSLAPAADYTDEVFYQVGRGPNFKTDDNTTGFRVGRNRVSGVYADVELDLAVTDSLVFFDDSAAGDFTNPKEPSLSFIDDETFLQGGDSGGPSFWISDAGEMLLIGTHSFITLRDSNEDSPFHDRRASGDAFLPAYRTEILQAAGILQVVAVPEASQLLVIPVLCAVIQVVALARRRR